MRDMWVKRAGSVLAGGLAGLYAPGGWRPWLFGALILGLITVWRRRPEDFFGRLWQPEALLVVAGIVAGFVYGGLAERSLPAPAGVDRIEVQAVILAWDQTDKATGVVRVETAQSDELIRMGESLAGQRFRLTVYPDKTGQLPAGWRNVQPGDWVEFVAGLYRPLPPGTEGGFDLRLYDAVRGLSGSLTARGDAAIVQTGRLSWPTLVRRRVRTLLANWDPGETGVLEGILFGDSSRIPPAVQERYKVTGVLHVFAASGSNVAIVLALVWGVSRFLPLQARIAVSVTGLIFYAALCGGNAPIIRATVLGIAGLFGMLGRGRVPGLRWLLFAAVGMFFINPLLLRDAGFQLSFTAAWGIMVIGPRLQNTGRFRRLPGLIRMVAVSTIAAQIATMPVLIMTFYRLSLVGLFANLAILFVIGGVLELGLIGVLLSFSLPLAAPFFQAGLWLLQITNRILAGLAAWPWADVWVLYPGRLFVVGWYGALGVWLYGPGRLWFILSVQGRRLRRRWLIWQERLTAFRVMGGLLKGVNLRLAQVIRGTLPKRWLGLGLVALLVWSPWNTKGLLEVAVLDIGQGDAIIIKTPRGHALLVDSGPRTERFDAGERIVLPYLLRQGIDRLDALLITHEHADHVGGAKALLANLPVDWIGVPVSADPAGSPEWQDGLPANLTGSSQIKKLGAGDRIMLDGGAWLDTIGPTKALSGTHSDPNNNSLVFILHYGQESILLGADMEQEEMEEIAGRGFDHNVTFLKEPHHGSRFSLDEQWLDQINPLAVFISVGKNTFGHPDPAVLNYWKNRQVPVYRTDQDGTIRLLMTKEGAEISLERNGR